MNFIVIDTEGRRELREIAIINSVGELIYEAFNQEYSQDIPRALSFQGLKTILLDFIAIASNKVLVFHNAVHDLKVLKRSFHQTNLPWKNFEHVNCTYQLARQLFPNSRYSLEYLAKKLNLKVDRQYFNPKQAHIARYDAQFTHQLYLVIRQKMTASTTRVNPFGSSRVDNPFQVHPDNTKIYSAQYAILESVIDDIKYD